MIRRVSFFIVVLLQVVFLIGMVAYHQKQLDTGFPVRLEVLPIDPDDLMRGEYVRLGYKMSNLDLTQIPHDAGSYDKGSTIYILLNRDTQLDSVLWIPKAVRKSQPTSSEFPFIKGQIQWSNQWSTPTSRNFQVNTDYSIGQYYVQEGRAKEIQAVIGNWTQSTSRHVSVEVRLAKDGTPAIAKLFVDNKEFR